MMYVELFGGAGGFDVFHRQKDLITYFKTRTWVVLAIVCCSVLLVGTSDVVGTELV